VKWGKEAVCHLAARRSEHCLNDHPHVGKCVIKLRHLKLACVLFANDPKNLGCLGNDHLQLLHWLVSDSFVMIPCTHGYSLLKCILRLICNLKNIQISPKRTETSIINPLKPMLVFKTFKNLVCTWKKTPHFTMKRINWLMLFKEVLNCNRCLDWET
jgi:hypothetical protein